MKPKPNRRFEAMPAVPEQDPAWKDPASPRFALVLGEISCCRAIVQGDPDGRTVNNHAKPEGHGANGQISLGKHHAGRQVLVEEREPGVWLIRTATVVPDNERWLQHAQPLTDLENALAWARANPPADHEVDRVLAKLNGEA